ncbi:hypothetical protein [Levilactobacillus humaensis]|uniref:hypothetical protein n=1 Tax=Levilactobacillus humaensis TaxID=2950375 RepID=UPI0021C429BB|nr:hypothetical protein [Levilactobacillus humaensis]
MKKQTFIMTAMALAAFGVVGSTTTAHAASHWKAAQWVDLTKTVKVDKIQNSTAKKLKTYTIKSGTRYKMSHWTGVTRWVVQSGRFNSGKKYTYAVRKGGNNTSWFKMTKYLPFHGYRIATEFTMDKVNTFYSKDQDSSILSDFKPTQYKKVIFDNDLKAFNPKHHQWDWEHGDYITTYKYKKGSWHYISSRNYTL